MTKKELEQLFKDLQEKLLYLEEMRSIDNQSWFDEIRKLKKDKNEQH